MSKPRIYIPYKVNLTSTDRERLTKVAQLEGKQKGTILRQAVRWYLEHYEAIKNEKRDSVYASQLKDTANRLAAMLYRLSVATETLYEFQWSLLDDNSQSLFEACNTKAKTKLRKRLVQEEREVIQKITEEPKR